MNVTGDFGSYIKEGPVLSTGQTANRTINIVIPSNETLGPHMIDLFVSLDGWVWSVSDIYRFSS